MVYRRILCLGWLLCVACSTPAALPESAPTRPYLGPLGLVFDIPLDFTESVEGLAHIFSGPKNTDSYYVTLSLQLRGGPLQLDGALDEAFVELRDTEQLVWLIREPIFIDDTPALRYGVTFEFMETVHTEVGVLLVRDNTLLDLSCLAPSDMLPQAVPICDTVLDSARLL